MSYASLSLLGELKFAGLGLASLRLGGFELTGLRLAGFGLAGLLLGDIRRGGFQEAAPGACLSIATGAGQKHRFKHFA